MSAENGFFLIDMKGWREYYRPLHVELNSDGAISLSTLRQGVCRFYNEAIGFESYKKGLPGIDVFPEPTKNHTYFWYEKQQNGRLAVVNEALNEDFTWLGVFALVRSLACNDKQSMEYRFLSSVASVCFANPTPSIDISISNN